LGAGFSSVQGIEPKRTCTGQRQQNLRIGNEFMTSDTPADERL
jgi:hypothetical protein